MQKVSTNGRLFYCNSCTKIHFEYLNIGVDFEDFKTLKEFTKYLFSINLDDYSEINNDTSYKKIIMVSFPDTSVKLHINRKQVEELKKLFESFILERYKRENHSEFKGFLRYTIDFPKVGLN